MQPPKAYKNLDFLNSPAARHIRILCEYEETRQRFKREGVRDTIVMFGSARTKPRSVADAMLAEAEAAVAAGAEDSARALAQARNAVNMSRYYEDARELARRLTDWSMHSYGPSYYVCSGGGPGIMEAANRGAADVPGGRSVGLGHLLALRARRQRVGHRRARLRVPLLLHPQVLVPLPVQGPGDLPWRLRHPR